MKEKSETKNRQQRPLNIILLGDPAAGKATQSALLAKRLHLYDLDMGRELRRIKNKESRKKYKLAQTLDKGKLTPTSLVRQILRDQIHATHESRGILFDGTPKMVGEAKLVWKWLKAEQRRDPIVIYLSIPMNETMKRMSNRQEYFKGKFSKRLDDTYEALKNRVNYYRKNIAQVMIFFQRHYLFKKVSGVGSVAEVHQRIAKAIKDLKQKAGT